MRANQARPILAAILLSLAATAFAAPPRVNLHDLGDAPRVLSPDYFGMDFEMYLLGAGGTYWASAGLIVEAAPGVRIVYAEDPPGTAVVTRPDRDGNPLTDAERFVTFVSNPRGQEVARRYRSSGEPVVVGRHVGDGPAVLLPLECNVAYEAPGTDEGTGYVARVVVDTANLPLIAVRAAYIVEAPASDEIDDVLLFSGRIRLSSDTEQQTFPFSVYAPADCNANGIPDSDENPDDDPLLADCNGNGVADGCDVQDGAPDLNGNGLPDECEDCDLNGIPDDLDMLTCPDGDPHCADCDGNDVLDGCDVLVAAVSQTTGLVNYTAEEQEFDFGLLPPAEGPVEVRLDVRARLNGPARRVGLRLNGVDFGDLFETTGLNCELATESLILPAATFNQLGASVDGLVVTLQGTDGILINCSGTTRIGVTIEYPRATHDCDQDGVPDRCEQEVDCDGDGVCNALAIANCPPDVPDCGDRNGNGIPDACDITNCPADDPNCADCNLNGIPDGVELATCDGDPNCADCNGNGLLDACEAMPREAGPRSPLSYLRPQVFVFSGLTEARGPVEIEVTFEGLTNTGRLYVDLDGTQFGNFLLSDVPPCEAATRTLTVGENAFNQRLSDGEIRVRLRTSSPVRFVCPDPSARVRLVYAPRGGSDCDVNGLPDDCEVLPDCDGDGVPDACALSLCNGGNRCDDCDGNGIPDGCDLDNCPPGELWCADADGNNRLDVCDADCDGDGIPDAAEIANCPPGDPNCADCNGNGIPDACDVASGDPNQADCDDNGVPDSCQLTAFARYTDDPVSPIEAGQTLTVSATGIARPAREVYITLAIDGWTTADEQIAVIRLNGVPVGTARRFASPSCSAYAGLNMPGAVFMAIVGPGGDLTLEATILGPLELCGSDPLSAQLDVAYYLDDCNDNGTVDACEIADGSALDNDGDGFPDECFPDCDGNGIADYIDIYEGRAGDCDRNGIPDACDLLNCDPLDPNAACRDCDGNGLLDLCEIAACPPGDPDCADCDGDQVIDRCQPDCNGDGVPDACEILNCVDLDPDCRDCDGDGVPDACRIAACAGDPNCVDCDQNGWLDVCEVQTYQGTATPIHGGVRFENVPYATGDVRITFRDRGDYDEPDEFLEVRFGYDGDFVPYQLFVEGEVCLLLEETLQFTAAEFNRFRRPDGRVRVLVPLLHSSCRYEAFEVTLEMIGQADCNGNGIPDACDLADGTAEDLNNTGLPDSCEADCDLDGTPDEDELGYPFHYASDQVAPNQFGTVLIDPGNLPPARGDVTCIFRSSANLRSSDERWILFEPPIYEVPSGLSWDLFESSGWADCVDRSETIRIPAERYNHFLSYAGTFGVFAWAEFDPSGCEQAWLSLELEYVADLGLDCDADGVPDACQLTDPVNDCNGNGVLDACEVAPPFRQVSGLSLPVLREGQYVTPFWMPELPPAYGDATLRLDLRYDLDPPTQLPCLIDGVPVGEFVLNGSSGCEAAVSEQTVGAAFLADALHDGELYLELTGLSPTIWCTATQAVLTVEYETDAGGDCNRNGRVDSCDIADGTSLDEDGDGVPDECVPVCSCEADFNQDQQIGIADLAVVLANFGQTGASFPDGDADGDGRVGMIDLARVLRFFGCVCP